MAGKAKMRKQQREIEQAKIARQEFDALEKALAEKKEQMKLFTKALEVGEECGLSPIETAIALRTMKRKAHERKRQAERGKRNKGKK